MKKYFKNLREKLLICYNVFTHKYYAFFSIKDISDGKRKGPASCYVSSSIEDGPYREVILNCISEMSIRLKNGKRNKKN